MWTTEWSGVLFYNYSGNFEDGSLEIHCVDIYPMDIGNATYTEFNMSPDVISYMAQKPELLDCKMGLIHSHNNMSTFFSGTDTQTLREEGNERNHFVSLIVNNAGKYTAAITRKIKYHDCTTRKSSYEGFSGPVSLNENDEFDGEEIEYFNLDIVFEKPVENQFGEISDRLDEIKKKKQSKPVYQPLPNTTPVIHNSLYADNYDYENMWDAYNKKPAAPTAVKPETDKTYPSLFSNYKEEKQVDSVDKKRINEIVMQLITGSVTITNLGEDAKKKVIDSMKSRFDKRFGANSSLNQFEYWATDFIEFLLWWSIDMQVVDDDQIVSIAEEIIKELQKLPKNRYIDSYIEILTDYAGKYQ